MEQMTSISPTQEAGDTLTQNSSGRQDDGVDTHWIYYW